MPESATDGHEYVSSITGLPVPGAAASVAFANSNPGITGYDVTFSFSWI